MQFAVALIGKPKLLFLDEPTTGLDIDARRLLWQTIRELSSEGTAIVLTTHYVEEADRLSDHVALLVSGKVAATGSANDIRRLVSGSLIKARTQIDINALERLPGVSQVRSLGRLVEMISDDVNQTLSTLLRLDPDLQDLGVSTPSLEDAVIKLNSEATESGLCN